MQTHFSLIELLKTNSKKKREGTKKEFTLKKILIK